jgi:hypothetical protein
LCKKFQVIHQHRNIVALMYVFAHPNIFRHKRRGVFQNTFNLLFIKF